MRRIFFILFCTTQVLAQSNPILYVASPKGLSLREGPSKDSKRIELLPYGKEINNYVIPEGKSITIDGYNGQWVNLLTDEGKSYYVFDGYTLPFKPPRKGQMLPYLIDIFGEIISYDSVPLSDAKEYGEMTHTYQFSSGVVFSQTTWYEADQCVIENLDLSVQKTYLFYYLLEENVYYAYHLLNKIDYPTKEYSSDTLNIEFNKKDVGDLFIEKANGGVFYVIISKKNGKTKLTFGGGV